MEVLAGTSGYSYKAWCGRFYPDRLPAGAMLRYYAERLPTVEINNTFYRMPGEAMLARWAQEVPAHFRFSLKAPRRITHDKRLLGAEDELAEFLRRAAVLGPKAGVFLFQLPPSQAKDPGRLRDFLAALPRGRRAAFEFRHDSWHRDDVYALLHEHGAILCATDTDEGEARFVATANEGYVRLRRTHYDDADLAGWLERLTAHPLERVHVYFMHEDEALGTRWAARLMALARGRNTAAGGESE
jgi:uncharacterized protein YecE (DUF72 family)